MDALLFPKKGTTGEQINSPILSRSSHVVDGLGQLLEFAVEMSFFEGHKLSRIGLDVK
jgi:hypothetical protein